MRIYRVHEAKDILRGPYQDWGNGFVQYHTSYSTPWAYKPTISERIWNAFIDSRAYCAWATATKLRDMLIHPKHWNHLLGELVVSIIEVEHYSILPDGQVLFMWDSAEVVQTIYTADELAALAEQEN